MWNEMASKHGLPKVIALTPKRKQRLKECWKILPEDIDKWRDSISQVPRNKFRLGENDRKWKANFDWFINTKTPFLTLLEEKQESFVETRKQPKQLERGVDNETASQHIGDILKGILN
jgi:hypothetical protein